MAIGIRVAEMNNKRGGAMFDITEKDLVCKMMVNKSIAVQFANTTEFEGKTYYFCSKTCKDKFDLSPTSYTEEKVA